MAICNLLTLTLRQNQNYESEALTVNQYCEEPEVVPAVDAQTFRDTMSINGRVMDIMGNMTDEQIEAVMKVGYNNSVEKMVEIITTCQDITDEELIDIFLNKSGYIGATNPTGAPQRLRIVRKSGGGSGGSGDSGAAGDATDTGNTSNQTDTGDNGNTITDTPEENAEYTLERKNQSKNRVNVTATPAGVTVCLENPMSNGKKYYYKVTSLTNSNIEATFQVLDNGRIVITGNDIKVVANEGQADDIFLIGHDNELHTGDGADIVRLGVSIDTAGVYNNRNESDTGNTPVTEALCNAAANNVYNNKVYLGAGNDYLYDYTNHIGGNANIIDGGQGSDSYRNTNDVYKNFEETNTIKDIEDIYTEETKDNNIDNNKKYSLESFGQGDLGAGDCRYIALLNSIKLSGKTLDQLGINISKSGTKYTVTFNKFKNAPKYSGEGNQNSITFDESDLYNYGGKVTVHASGDLTVRIVEYAMNQLVKINMPGKYSNDNGKTWDDHDLSSISGQDYSRYLYGTSAYSYQICADISSSVSVSEYFGTNNLDDIFYPDDVSEIKEMGYNTVDEYFAGYDIHNALQYAQEENILTLDQLWAKYQSGELSNLIVGTYDNYNGFSDELQICSKHAYAISDVTSTYVEVINPWDSQDRVRLDRADFFRLFAQFICYGSDALQWEPTGESWNCGQVQSSYSSINSNKFKPIVKDIFDKYYYKDNVYEEMQPVINNIIAFDNNSSNPFANIFTDDETSVYDEISEITDSIENVKQILEEKKTLELYS